MAKWESNNDPFTTWTTEDEKNRIRSKMQTIPVDKTFCPVCCEEIEHKTTREFQIHTEKCKASEYKRIREQASQDATHKMKADIRKEIEEEIRAELKAEILKEKKAK